VGDITKEIQWKFSDPVVSTKDVKSESHKDTL
jgi:hypothetical protein